MSRSTPTIFSIIEHTATLYKQAKSVAPTHVFISSYNYSNLAKEIGGSSYYREDITRAQRVAAIHTAVGELEVLVVKEDSNDFILIGREDDYLNYVMEKTVL